MCVGMAPIGFVLSLLDFGKVLKFEGQQLTLELQCSRSAQVYYLTCLMDAT